MGALIGKRILSLILVTFVMSLFVFLLARVVPGDPARAALGEEATTAMIAQFRAEYGLDLPLPRQYLRYARGLISGDLGRSLLTGRPVLADLLERFPATAELTLASMVWGLILGVPLGIVAAMRYGTAADMGVRIATLALVGIPIFWSSLILQLVFYGRLHLLPYGSRLTNIPDGFRTLTGFVTLDALLQWDLPTLGEALRHLLLPSFTLGSVLVAVVARAIRVSLRETLGEMYVTVARAKGLPSTRVLTRHALRNAMIPVVTIAALRFGELMSGAVVTETIFQWPGIGLYAVNAISRQDFQAVMGFVLLAASIFIIVNLLVDFAYLALDPRIRL